jgi:hypothetical protein
MIQEKCWAVLNVMDECFELYVTYTRSILFCEVSRSGDLCSARRWLFSALQFHRELSPKSPADEHCPETCRDSSGEHLTPINSLVLLAGGVNPDFLLYILVIIKFYRRS